MSSPSQQTLTPDRSGVQARLPPRLAPCELFSIVRTHKRNREVFVLNEILEPQPERKPICCICRSEPPTIVLVKCGHLCLCDNCGPNIDEGIDNCPICFKSVTIKTKVYFC